ncbi:hypothetical protein BBROOKSOX_1331 [Bathymodiolus brooksi thiotrophic gill symbiont]|nr:hypothetical protein BBROOKSOX_1331 [Bathymodiolus brooksi thiotrophic gill symbiont]
MNCDGKVIIGIESPLFLIKHLQVAITNVIDGNYIVNQ